MKCKVQNCPNENHIKGYCKKHYAQLYRLGCVKERTKADPNEFIIEGDICKIFLYDKEGNKRAEAIIDIKDYERCKQYKWCVGPRGYVWGNQIGNLSHFIFGRKPNIGFEMDHVDGDKFNNRRKNIQEITHQQNIFKAGERKNNTSGFQGVSWNKTKKKWTVQIQVNGKQIYLGEFSLKDKKKAALLYKEEAKKRFGKFIPVNIFQSDVKSETDCEQKEKILGG